MGVKATGVIGLFPCTSKIDGAAGNLVNLTINLALAGSSIFTLTATDPDTATLLIASDLSLIDILNNFSSYTGPGVVNEIDGSISIYNLNIGIPGGSWVATGAPKTFLTGGLDFTTQELINYYANLLIIQYIGKAKAYAHIQTLVTPVVMDQLPLSVQNAFNLTGSVGVQLDVLGKYIGVKRSGYGLSGQPITLNDADFLKLIQLALLTNSAQSDLNTIQSLLQIFFAGELFVFDYQDMRMSYFINSSIGSPDLIQLFITEGLLPKPMAVQLAAPILNANLKFFGMLSAKDVEKWAIQNSLTITASANAVATHDNISPFNTAAAPIIGEWLSVKLGVVI